mmetsp:Transcript_6766/g.11364  ORF Transcript_6766/g.11364 Transcript_6766/m.11364 type:complete len:90 (+) Transcript_6766:249-518(+)
MNAIPRADYYVCSKIPPGFQNFKKAKNIIKASVKAVDLGPLDCMLLLWPGTMKVDEKDEKNVQDRHEVWQALEEAVNEGELLGAGVSNF